jgi:hypothetical protein
VCVCECKWPQCKINVIQVRLLELGYVL